ncbi:hypothetical protein KC343_g421 [Hortaea werneckii]|nr:hypothetical protein KC352_g3503 [Hortaea werneckii]KAI7572762.1 hypothetical protein KC317_g466 [Hortaea werneckii]KAI7623980.1 hypothetical protein KC346_g2442 [Hortaea werneckii]KAI7637950.1 hypothetical protein KC343_g421 [Hortaea werneckii]KAI7682523.1 hypothetical protein KC319_g963 [Hortaea werneckii]
MANFMKNWLKNTAPAPPPAPSAPALKRKRAATPSDEEEVVATPPSNKPASAKLAASDRAIEQAVEQLGDEELLALSQNDGLTNVLTENVVLAAESVEAEDDDDEDDDDDDDDDDDTGARQIAVPQRFPLAPVCPVFKSMCETSVKIGRYPQIVDHLNAVGIDAAWRDAYGIICSNPRLKHVYDNDLWADKASLLSIKGNVRSRKGGWYADIVTDNGKADWYMPYVGQSGGLRRRVGKHLKSIEDGETHPLHYMVASKKGRKPNFVVFAEVDRSPSKEAAMFGLMEMYFALQLRSLPTAELKLYLPEGSRIPAPAIGLNLLCPLAQLHVEQRKWSIMSLYKDATGELKEYLQKLQRKAADAGLAALKKSEFKPISEAKRAASWRDAYVRGAQAGNAHEEIVPIKCGKCGNEKNDPSPVFAKKDGTYLNRVIMCDVCPKPEGPGGRGKRRTSITMHYPTDGRRYRTYSNEGNKERAKEAKRAVNGAS